MRPFGELFDTFRQKRRNLAVNIRARIATAMLRGLEPGRQPLVLFKEFCRLTVASTVEVVPIRDQGEDPEVLLTRRSAKDPWWPGMLVLPGIVILPTDKRDAQNSLEGPIARLFNDELPGIGRVGDLHPLPAQFRHDGRGLEVTNQFWTLAETGDDPHQGTFYNVDKLRQAEPEGGVLPEGWLTIDRAVAGYNAFIALQNDK